MVSVFKFHNLIKLYFLKHIMKCNNVLLIFIQFKMLNCIHFCWYLNVKTTCKMPEWISINEEYCSFNNFELFLVNILEKKFCDWIIYVYGWVIHLYSKYCIKIFFSLINRFGVLYDRNVKGYKMLCLWIGNRKYMTKKRYVTQFLGLV